MSALSDVKSLFPGPGRCVTGSELVSKYLGMGKWTKAPCGGKCQYVAQAIIDMNQAINDWHQPRGETLYVNAYKQVINEYTAYYNNNCAAAAPVNDPGQIASPGSGTTPITVDPITGQNVVPSPGGSSLTNPSSGTSSTSSTTTLSDKLKTVPKWVWYAGGGLLVLTVVIVLARRSN